MAIGNSSIEIIPSSQICLGNSSGRIKIELFGDYETAATLDAHLLAKKMVEKYPDEIRYYFRHFPLTQVHQQSQKAAEAAVGAAQENKFWEMHERLLKEKQLGVISLKLYARDEGVTDKKFLDKLVNSTFGWTVRADLLEGLDRGVRSVPSFMINDQPVLIDGNWAKLPKVVKELLSELNSVKD